GGNLGEAGSVGWIFDKKGCIIIEKEAKPEDELFEVVTEAGAEDLRDDGDNFEIITDPTGFDVVLNAVKTSGIEPLSAEISMIPQNYIKLEGSSANQMLKLMETLEDHDDVQKVFANFDIDVSEME
ncbi:MAG: YebC/PmpR family DNA-binding transcriptional regulator, partial [Pyrinomonadaceae bacterium]